MAEGLWLTLGLVGQAIFGSRFVVQWISSERAGQSVVPVSFWYLSLGGALLLLTYAIYKQDPVFIIGQSVGGFIYARNLSLIARKKGSSDGPEKAQ
ncbi:MAG: lipid-A-disaccharide synthase N-terminal domain-containing protein [Candidatus Eisenbacteria bacterium]|nr:lipid-A-disaccharide synthase N-terminal domain-containing protein [Candidatus Eisenbacteria bacterium]